MANSNVTRWRSTPPQSRFWKLWFLGRAWALAFVAGFGSGKSEILHVVAVAIIIMFPWANVAVYSPTYDLLKLNNIPRIGELLTAAGLKWRFNKADFIFTIEGHGQIICRSMDNPGRIIAYGVFASLVDELDTMSTAKADEAWNKIIARNRQQPPLDTLIPKGTNVLFGEPPEEDEEDTRELITLKYDTPFSNNMELLNKCGVFTTPEGFKFTYKKWEKESNDGYEMVKASTYSNKHLPKSYIKTMKDTYPAQLIEAYLNGEFVNLNGFAVYHAFNRFNNSTNLTFDTFENEVLTSAV